MRDLDAARRAADGPLPNGPFRGVPFLAKDTNQDVAGFPTTHSCRFFEGSPVRQDGVLARRWRAAGLVILGKTNTPELAGDFTTEPALRGATRNPWKLDLSTGGSSGGAGAAVASGMVPMAHGTDLGGSIRMPASLCGVFGFKPTPGLVPLGPDRDEIACGLNSDHALTRSVRDSAALLDATMAPDPGAPYPPPAPARPFRVEVGAPTGRLRIAVTTQAPGGQAMHPESVAAVEATRTLLADMGHELVPYAWTVGMEYLDASLPLWTAGIADEIDRHAAELGRGPAEGELEPLTRETYERAKRLTAPEFMAARRLGNRIRRRMAQDFEAFDALVTPSTAGVALPLGRLGGVAGMQDKDQWLGTGYDFAPFHELFNLTHQPAMSVPLHWTADNLPVGVQFVARHGDDALLFRLAGALERAKPWAERHPPLWG
jgi:amidase